MLTAYDMKLQFLQTLTNSVQDLRAELQNHIRSLASYSTEQLVFVTPVKLHSVARPAILTHKLSPRPACCFSLL
jgi:hypothetical protein